MFLSRYTRFNLFLVILAMGALLFSHGVLADDANLENATKEQLQQQLAAVEAQIKEYQSELTTTTNQKNTLTNKIKQLQLQVSSLQAQIKQTTLKIAQLNQQLDTTKQSITATQSKEDQLKEQLAAILKLVNQHDHELLFETLASQNGLADSFVAIQNYNTVFSAIQSLTTQAQQAEAVLTQQKQAFSDAEDNAQQFLQLKAAQQTALTDTISDQKDLLTQTNGKVAAVQSQLTITKQQAAAIQNRLYQLTGATTQITFGQALDIANQIAISVPIRPAFLLAILTQESNLGANVGTCNRAGDPPNKSWKVVMKPERDQKPFQQITSALGKDIDTTPVSCPMYNKDGSQNGWGGAMGPAQFIPSTWMGYAPKVTAITGAPIANPWDDRDAFLASALKLSADGASAKTDQGDWNAAMRYFSGGLNLAYRFYGDNVLATEKKYQADIDSLNSQK